MARIPPPPPTPKTFIYCSRYMYVLLLYLASSYPGPHYQTAVWSCGGGREGGRGSSSWWYSTYIVSIVTRYHSFCSVLKYCHLFKTLKQMGVLEVWLGVLAGVCMCVVVVVVVVVVVARGWLGDLIS